MGAEGLIEDEVVEGVVVDEVVSVIEVDVVADVATVAADEVNHAAEEHPEGADVVESASLEVVDQVRKAVNDTS